MKNVKDYVYYLICNKEMEYECYNVIFYPHTYIYIDMHTYEYIHSFIHAYTWRYCYIMTGGEIRKKV